MNVFSRIIICALAAGQLLVSTVSDLPAEEHTIVRIKAHPETPWVGQKVVLLLDILSKNGWAQLKTARTPEIRGGHLIRYETQGTRLNETIDGSEYTGQQYEYLFFPQHEGIVTIPAIPIDIEVKTWGNKAQTNTLTTKTATVTLNVKIPPGVQPLKNVISTASFSITQQWTPDTEEYALGDAVRRTITRNADDVSGMAFPPGTREAIDGLGIYPSEPVVADTYSRGTLSGRRTEAVTYIFEKPGHYLIPDLTFNWWDTNSGELKTVILPGKSLDITAVITPQGQGGGVSAVDTRYKSEGLLLFIAVIIITPLLLYPARKRLHGRYQVWKRTREESEKNWFKKVGVAAHSGKQREMIRVSMQWLDRISPGHLPARLDLFLARYGDTESQIEIQDMLDETDPATESLNIKRLYKQLIAARHRWKKAQKIKKISAILPEIRPQ